MVDVKAVSAVLEQTPLDSETREYLLGSLADCETEEEAMDLLAPFLEEASAETPDRLDELCGRIRQALSLSRETTVQAGAEGGVSAPTVLEVPMSLGARNTQASEAADAALDPAATARNAAANAAVTLFTNAGAAGHEGEASGHSAKGKRRKNKATAAENEGKAAAPSQKADNTPAATVAAAAAAHLNVAKLQVSSEESRFQRDAVGDSEEVQVRRIDLAFEGTPPLLEGATLRLMPGRCYGLLGANGSGKSTLLRCIASGNLPGFPNHIGVLYIDQDARTPDKTVMQFVLDGDTEMAALLHERDALMAAGGSAAVAEGAARFAEVQSELALLDGGEASVRARRALAALGFAPEQTGLPLRNFSGGWRVKASLARALFCPPRFLFLDEPTNHLDLHEIIRLQQLLRRLNESCIVVVSHDRAFLDAVATDMMVLRNRKIVYFSGNLSAYLKDKEDRRVKQQRLYDAQERKRAHIQATIDKGVQTARRTGNDKVLGMVASRKKKLNERLGAEKREDGKRWRTNTRRATDTQKKYEAAVDGARQELEAPKEDKLPVFKFLEPPPLLIHGACLQMEDVSFTYPGAAAPVLQHVSLSVEPITRLGLLGRNGAGKSTLVGLLMQTLTPTRGEITHRRQATVRLFNQHHADSLAPDSCPLRHMMEHFPEEKEQVLRNHLGSFGIAGGLAVLDNEELSGGQKTRVALAALTFARPHILVLDEPTNHLDFESVQALQQALADFEGGLVLVSHDRHFMAECARDLCLVEGGKVERFDGSVADYAVAVEAEAGILEV